MKKTIFLALAFVSSLASFSAAEDITTNMVIDRNVQKDFSYVTVGNGYVDENAKSGSLVNEGLIKADQIYIQNGFLVNNGTIANHEPYEDILDGDLLVMWDEDGYLTNNGRIEGYVRAGAGTLNLTNGSYTQVVDVYAGAQLFVDGNVTMEYLYLDDDTELTFTLDSSIDLSGGLLQIYDTRLVLLIDEDIENGDTSTDFGYLNCNLFTNFSDDPYGWGIFSDDISVTIRDANGDEVVRSYSSLSIPEPATATLSLLALAALAVRRRRI